MPFFDRGPISLFYTTHGVPSAQPILLLHGWACDSHDWSHQIPLLTSLNFHVIALDHRGHGCSSAPPSISDYSMRVLADDVVALLEYLQTGPVILVAHSLSTVEHPKAVKALVLVHPIYCGTPPALATMSEAMKKDPSSAPEMVAGFFEHYMYTAETPEWLKMWHIRRVLGTDATALAGCAQGLVELFGNVVGQTEETKAFMKKRTVPRLVVATNALPAAVAWEEDMGLVVRDKVCIMDRGTFSHFVQSEEFNKLLEEWLVGDYFDKQD